MTNCKKFYYSNYKNIAPNLNFLPWFDNGTEYVLTFYKPFLLYGFATLESISTGTIIPAPVVKQTNNYPLCIQLAIAFMEANRDGIDSTHSVTYAPLPGGPDFSEYFNQKLNTENKPEFYASFLSAFNQIKGYWDDTLANLPIDPTTELYRFMEYTFKNTNRQLWLAPGVYTVPYSTGVDDFVMQFLNSVIGSFDGSPHSIQQQQITPVGPLPPVDVPADDWYFSITLQQLIAGVPSAPSITITNDGSQPPNDGIPSPVFSTFPGNPIAAIDAWLGTDDGNNFFRNVVYANTINPSSDFIVPGMPSDAAIYGSAMGTDGQTYLPGTGIYIRFGTGIDWSGTPFAAIVPEQFSAITDLRFYKPNPFQPAIANLQGDINPPIASMIIEQQSIE